MCVQCCEICGFLLTCIPCTNKQNKRKVVPKVIINPLTPIKMN